MSSPHSEDSPNLKKPEKRAYVGDGRHNNPMSNPCIKEQNLSMKCLNDNNHCKEVCEVYFVNYKNCKAFWNQVTRERRAQGITPYLPLPHERDEMMRRLRGPKQ